ncbi:MAG: tetratricopeptide repeat protein [Armatimonadota bacterium]
MKQLTKLTLTALLVTVVGVCGCHTRSQRIYQRAEAFMAAGKENLAAREYRKLVTETPGSPLADDALYKLAHLFREEFKLPDSAIHTYRLIARNYPDSSYVDEAYLWIAYIQRRDLHSPEDVRKTCEAAEKRFTNQPATVARCYLQLVQALYAERRYEETMQTADMLQEKYPDQKRQCSVAALLKARAAQETLDDEKQVEELYTRVLELYPDSYSAVQAKTVIGLRYFDKRAEQQQEEQERLKAAARVMHGVPPFSVHNDYRENVLAPLQSLLAHRNVQINRKGLLAMSGAAFGFAYDPNDVSAASRIFYRQPHVFIGETLGFSTSVWTGEEAEASFNALTNAIRLQRPVIVHHSSPQPRWAIVTGWRPAADQVLYLAAGADEVAGATRERFISRWTATDDFGYGPHYLFFLGQRNTQPSADELVRETLRVALASMESRNVNGAHCGIKAYDTLASALEDNPADNAEKLVLWAQAQIPVLQDCRRAAQAFLSEKASTLPAAHDDLIAAADFYEDVEAELDVLRGAILRAAEDDDRTPEEIEAGWQRTVRQVKYIQQLEDHARQKLQAALNR